MRGNHVLGEAAICAGCRFYFGYPITPQNEVPEYLSKRLLEVGGTFVQAESELASINMVMGAAMAGMRVMTSSSSPGISLMQEGLSFLAGLELPAVIANMMRGGPGLGNIAPSQGDYFQATRGGGHGDYRTLVLAPASVAELAAMTFDAFELADRYRNPVLVLGDGMLGQMMEPVEFKEYLSPKTLPKKPWSFGREKFLYSRTHRSLILDPGEMEEHNHKLLRKYNAVQENETAFETTMTDDAELLVVAYGTAARIAKGAVLRTRKMGMNVGLFRPKTLWPFPSKELCRLSEKVKNILVFEMSTGQMVEDVKLSVKDKESVSFYGRPGGVISTPEEIAHRISHVYLQSKLNEGMERHTYGAMQ